MTELELAERCEQAPGPRWYIDEDIAKALGWYCRKETSLGMNGRTPGRMVWRRPDGVKAPLPKFSKSLDAAMTLVPEGEFICIDGPRKYLNIPTPVPNYWRACIGYSPEHRGWGATPALALCAAALRARASQ